MKNLLRILASSLIVATSVFLIITEGNGGNLSSTSSIEDFNGKPSVLVFGGTYCPHCQKAVPEIEKQVWDVYQNEINLWLQVVDGAGGKTFDTSMPQGLNENLSYEELAGEDCGYVPAWVLMDATGKTVLTSCGSDKSTAKLAEGIDGLL